MNDVKKQHAAAWLAFTAGMAAQAAFDAARVLGDDPASLQERAAEAADEFAFDLGDDFRDLGMTRKEVVANFENGRTFLAEMRDRAMAEAFGAPAKPEDGLPLLTGKPDRRLS